MTETTERPEIAEPGRMTLIEHLAELRTRLVKAVIAVALGAVIAWIAYPQIFDILIRPYQQACLQDVILTDGDGNAIDPSETPVNQVPTTVAGEPAASTTTPPTTIAPAQTTIVDPNVLRACTLIQTEPLEGFSVRIKVASYGGIALAMPVILFQVWRFITPGLYDHEKRYAIPFVVSAVVLFLLGAGLAYYTLPRAIAFLTTIGGDELTTVFAPAAYFQLVSYMMLAFGLGFEFPILLIFLQIAGLVDHKMLSSGRRYAVVGIVVLVAVITPSGDPYSLAILSVPMYLFYEISIVVGRILQKRKTKSDAVAA